MQLSAFDNGASKGSVEPHAAISVFHDNKEGRHGDGDGSGGIPLPSGTTHLTWQMSHDSPKLPMQLQAFVLSTLPKKVWGVTCHQKMNLTLKNTGIKISAPMPIQSWWIFPPLGVHARLHTSLSLTLAPCVSITLFTSGSFNVLFCVCTPSTGLWHNTHVRNGIDTVLEPKLEVRQGPCGSMKERMWEAICRKTHTLQRKGRKAGLVTLPLAEQSFQGYS